MTRSEFVRVSAGEKIFGDKHLLQSELELLNLVQSFKKYKELRLDELTLKVGLKAKLEELEKEIDKIERLLPAAGYHAEKKEKVESKAEKKKESFTLEQEIERIRKKISRLERGEGY
jgi:valyl-tRNA synthetase